MFRLILFKKSLANVVQRPLSRYQNWEHFLQNREYMMFSVYVNEINDYLCLEKAVENQSVAGFIQEKKVVFKHDHGFIADEQVNLGNMLLSSCNFKSNHKLQLQKQSDEELIQLYFSISGSSVIEVAGHNNKKLFHSGEHNICYVPPAVSIQDYQQFDFKHDLFIVTMPIDVYFGLVPFDSLVHGHYLNKITEKDPGFHQEQNPGITEVMLRIISEIRACPFTGQLKKLFLEARVIELLMRQLEQMQNPDSNKRVTGGTIRLKIMEACEYLDAHFQSPPTIVQLSKIIGINEFTLKQGFKEHVGNTIFGYVNGLRMDHAQKMVLDGQQSLAEISYWIGYKNPAHFTLAYKRYFGMPPSRSRAVRFKIKE